MNGKNQAKDRFLWKRLAFRPNNLKLEVIRMGKFMALVIVGSVLYMAAVGPKKAVLFMFKEAAKVYQKGPISHSEFTRQLTSK